MVRLAFSLLLLGTMASCSSKDVVMNDEVAAPPPASASTEGAAPVTVAANEPAQTARQPNSPEPSNLGAASAGRGR